MFLFKNELKYTWKFFSSKNLVEDIISLSFSSNCKIVTNDKVALDKKIFT